MTADVELLPCGECGMPCRPGEYHPYAACLMFKTCRNSDTVRGNLQDAQDHATAAKDAEIEALRAEVEMLRDAFSDEDMTAGAHWFGRYVEQKRRAEQLAEAIRAYKSECDNPAKDYVMRAKRRDEMFAALNPTAAQENDDA